MQYYSKNKSLTRITKTQKISTASRGSKARGKGDFGIKIKQALNSTSSNVL